MIGSDKKKDFADDIPPVHHATSSRLGPGFEMTGDLKAQEDLIISGRFKGKIEMVQSTLIVEEKAFVEGEIHIRDIVIRGRLDGTVQASGRVEIRSAAQVTGDITTARIVIEDGAQFKGSVKMRKTVSA